MIADELHKLFDLLQKGAITNEVQPLKNACHKKIFPVHKIISQKNIFGVLKTLNCISHKKSMYEKDSNICLAVNRVGY